MDKPILPDGVISRSVREGLKLRRQLLDDGTPEHEADRIVGQGLKAAWEHSTGRASDAEITGKYLCGKCFDSGWLIVQPSYLERKRLAHLYGDNPQHQDYMAKCEPCPWIDSERRKRREQGGEVEGLVAAGQMTRRRSKFSRF